ncbi:cytochrome P450 [Massarina eburnea CBS 473.64]|uniref:Cytochrome P450 n=1 Tax=Massarina eburnea CBS 473.64 TaxID=1395130 RepID=A0A6A6RJB5_9PLEO|nr:cytochrome P450 [Massarina eburnea CBS 473.64]
MTVGKFLSLLPSLVLLFACVVIKLAFVTPLVGKWNFPLSQIPGPTLAGWTRLWLIKTLYSGKWAEELVNLHRKYGKFRPIVRIGPRHVIISNPESIRRVLATGSDYTRGPWFDTLRLHPNRANVISERDPKKHQRLRHILGPGLAGKTISNMQTVVDEHIKDWISMIWNKHATNKTGPRSLDLSKSIPYLTVDLISHLCLGESFGCTEKQADSLGFIQAMRVGMILQQYTSVLLEANTCLSRLGRTYFVRPFIYPTHKDTVGVGKTMQRIHQAVMKRDDTNRAGELSGNLLDSFIARGLPEDQIYSEMIIILAGGTDTTATAAQGIIFSILSNPAVLSRLRTEIDSFQAEKAKFLTFPIQDSMARKLPYLQACIAEGLRKYPPLFQLRERVVPPQGDSLHGYYIPPGTFVGINGLATQLDDVYGDNVDAFEPERWLIDDKERLRGMNRTLELVFGYGGSKCLGVNMAYMELNKIIFELFSHFDISFVNPSQPWKRKARGIFIQSDFNVVMKRRTDIAC